VQLTRSRYPGQVNSNPGWRYWDRHPFRIGVCLRISSGQFSVGGIIVLMIRRILTALVGLSLSSLVFAQSSPLFFKEVWTINGAAHAIAPGENVLTNANLELKLYGPSATASDPDKRIWISTPPTNIWTGMTTTPCAAILRDK